MTLCRPLLRTLTACAATACWLSSVEAQVAVPADPVPVDAQPFCQAIADPFPSGSNQAPPDQWADPFLFPNPTVSNDYHWMQASMNLQGAPATQKWGACLFYHPTPSQTGNVDLSDWTSALVVNNPSPTVTVTATITYRSPAGVAVGGSPFVITLGPEQTFARGAIELAGTGIGSVEVNADAPIVGATLHHFGHVTFSNGDTYKDPDDLSPGDGSLQQLQMSQSSKKILYSGPFPATNTAAEDFLNGILPLNCVLNPNPSITTVTLTSIISPSTPLTTATFTLPPFGMLLDTSLWSIAEPFYLSSPGPFNFDILYTAASNNGPILGDFLMVDVFGNGPPSNLVPGGRLRVGSGMMQNTPALRLLNAEHTETGPFALPGPLSPTPPVETMMGIANMTGSDIGPVSVQFFSRSGASIASLSFPTLPAFSVRRITPATSPIPQNFGGWARITACHPGLIGWTMREVMKQTSPVVTQFQKVYGEELDGANGAEPGTGYSVNVGGTNVLRKVAPILRVAGNNSNPNWYPSYINPVNNTSANLGPYWLRFFTLPGTASGNLPLGGLQFANTAFNFIDFIATVTVDSNLSGRFDRTTGSNAIGMEAAGGALAQWGILFFP